MNSTPQNSELTFNTEVFPAATYLVSNSMFNKKIDMVIYKLPTTSII